MSLTIAGRTGPTLFLRAGAAALAVLALTSIHHAYGAIVYETPWRMHIVYVAIPVGLAIAFAFYVGWSKSSTSAGRIATWLGALATVAFPVALIGLCRPTSLFAPTDASRRASLAGMPTTNGRLMT